MIRLTLIAVATLCFISSCASRPYYDAPPTMPANLLPTDSVDIESGSDMVFTWRAAERADHYEFHIFNRYNNDILDYYLRDMLPEDVCINDVCSINVVVNLPVLNDHAWRVRAGNNAGMSDWTRSIFNIVAAGN